MDIEISELPKNPYSFGVIVRFLSMHKPFSEFEFGSMSKSILFQIQNDSHLVAIKDDQVIGYLGWLRTTEEIARAWQDENTPLRPAENPTALAVTIFAVSEQSFIRPIIRYAKKREPGLTVFWKRYYQDGREPKRKVVEVE
ncbi:hypothetical protein N9809_07315 [Amylibacter sp.]|nr:hypothetical protein [Amylibacter sp.]